MGILNEYEEILIGNRSQISGCYFIFDRKGNERVALTVIKYALENLLGWNRYESIQFFNANYIEIMKLNQMVSYIDFPSDVTRDDTEYILHLLYPRQVDYEIRKYTLRVYDDVMAGKRRYPKDYMYGSLGMTRAKICLQHVLRNTKLFKTPDELYKFFITPECLRYLKKNKLYQLYISFYDTPLEYMYDSIPSSLKNEFLFHNYMFESLYEKEKAKTGAKTGSKEGSKEGPKTEPKEGSKESSKSKPKNAQKKMQEP